MLGSRRVHARRARIAVATGIVAALAGALVAGAGALPADAATTAAAVTTTTAATTAATVKQPAGIKGIDIYELSPTIDYAAQYDRGVRFVYIKASGGTTVDNDKLASQWAASKGTASKPLIHGAYHKALPNGPSKTAFASNGTAQADYFLDQSADQGVGEPLWTPGGQTLPPMLDLEVAPGVSTSLPLAERQKLLCYSMTSTQIATYTAAFSKEILAKTGRSPVIYTNPDFWQNCMKNSASFTANPLFQASYNPTVGTIGKSWSTYSMWQWDDEASLGSKAVDQDVYNGTMTSLHLLADPTYGFSNTPQTRNHDYNGDGHQDVLAISSTGVLYDYRGNGAGGFESPANVSIATGMSSYNAFAAVGTATSKGNPGIYARGKSGTLYYFGISPKGSLGTRVTVATGWSGMSQITSAGDFNGDGYADIVAVDKVGVLWLYLGDKTGKFSGRVQLATGWNAKTAIIGGSDVTGDGYADLLARDSSGALAVYSHVPQTAGLVKKTLPSTGWNDMTKIFTPGDFTGDGKADLMSIGKTGQMYIYKGDGAGGFGARTKVGTTTSWGTRTFLG